METGYEIYYDELRKFVSMQTRNSQSVDDIVQNIYLKILKYQREGIEDKKKWMWKVAWNCIRNHFRKKNEIGRHEVQMVDGKIEMGEFLLSPERQVIADQELANFLDSFSSNTVSVKMYSAMGYSYREIGLKLGVSAHTVKYHAMRRQK